MISKNMPSVSSVAAQQDGSWFKSQLGPLVCMLHVLSRYSGFLQPSKNMHVSLIGVSVHGSSSLCGPMMDLSRAASQPMTAGIGSGPPRLDGW